MHRAPRILLFAVVLLSAGCARAFRHYDTAPNGLSRSDDRLRTLLATSADSLLLRALDERDALPSDPLLALAYRGVVAYHAGDYRAAVEALDAATIEAEIRRTRSVSRSAASFISTDRVLPWEPGPTERLLLPYYAALAYLRTGQPEEAAVEARRLSALLEQADVDESLRGLLRYFAGSVFAAAGEHNDALVAFRHAYAASPGLPAADTLDGGIAGDSADVVIFATSGFVGHRVEQSIMLFLDGDEVEGLTGGDDRAEVATLVAARVVEAALQDDGRGSTLFVQAPRRSKHRRKCVDSAPSADSAAQATAVSSQEPTPGTATGVANTGSDDKSCDDDDENNPYLMRIAWPAFRESYRAPAALRLRIDTAAHEAGFRASVSSAVRSDFERDRPLLVAKTIARAAAKLALTRGAEESVGEKNETAGRIIGLLSNVGTALLEQADTRSWTLLPASIEVVRARVPAGVHEITVETGDGTRTIDLGTITLRPGETRILPASLF